MIDDHGEVSISLVDQSAEIVGAFVAHNTVSPSDLPGLIATVHRALSALRGQPAEPIAPPQEPAVPIRKSIRPEGIVCLEDGKSFKSLKRHLGTYHNLTPEQYPTEVEAACRLSDGRAGLLGQALRVGQEHRARQEAKVRRQGVSTGRAKTLVIHRFSRGPRGPGCASSLPLGPSTTAYRARRPICSCTAS